MPEAPLPRLRSVDAYRGLVMFLMMAEVLRLPEMAKVFPNSEFWKWVAFNTTHVAWRGCSLHDLIQPSFSFLVGVALSFSFANRSAQGQTPHWMIWRAIWRAIVLVLLGIFLRSIDKPQTYFTFEDTLTQIGLGYVPLFLLNFCSRRWQWMALVVIIVGYWGAFALYPLPSADFDYLSVGVGEDWTQHASGFAAHWNKNSNLGWAFDTWWLNLFPRERPFTYHPGAYTTLNFIPTLGTMIFGLIAGDWLRDREAASRKLGRLVLCGLICVALGWSADHWGICPSVKRIWTPSWTVFSAGWCFLLLAGFYGIIDVAKWQAWSLPLVVLGVNSIAAYVMAHPLAKFLIATVHTHLDFALRRLPVEAYATLVTGVIVLGIEWLILYWMYRRKIFLKI
jgi:heparan-alpha-glucosaminide N-acetyltransferase